KHSSDVGAIKIGMKLGDQEMYHYIEAYGFGRPTGLRLPGESRGIVRPPQRWTAMSIGAVSMGQEVAVTPMQVIALISTLADGGIYHAPRVLLDTFTGDPPPAPPRFEPAGGRRVVSPMVANEMKQMMAQVVLAGTAQQAQLDGYTAAGKTGTAQKVDPGTHLYSARDFVSSFGGFAPINDPAVAILVVLDSPQGGHEGGATAGPVFKAIADQVLPYLGVAHDIPVQAQPAPIRIAAADAVEESEEISTPAVEDSAGAATGDPAPAAAPPAPGSAASARARDKTLVVLDYSSGEAVLAPDFTGQTVRAVSARCQKLGLDLALQGSGVARSQTPAPGTHLAPGARMTVRFAPGSP
ncbi:MAG: penicillin-binding transpeptidase domain-containing protein, partial [Terriglobales bacterium]